MNTANKKPNRLVRYSLIAAGVAVILATIHFSIQGDLVGAIMAMHGR